MLFFVASESEEWEVEDDRDGEVTDDAQLASLAEEFDRYGQGTEDFWPPFARTGAKWSDSCFNSAASSRKGVSTFLKVTF